MVDQAVNFKKMADERYRVYRIIRSNQLCTPMYRHLLKTIGHYNGAIIFPEQLIGVDRVYVVALIGNENYSTSGSSHQIITESFTLAELRGPEGEDPIARAEDVLDVEQRFTDPADTFKIAISTAASYYSLIDFKQVSKRDGANRFWFSNSRDATKFAQSQIRF